MPGSAGAAGAPIIGLPDSANGITKTTGAGRADPEGVAPASPSVTEISWRDAHGGPRQLTLHGHLYGYEFGFLGGDAAEPNKIVTRVVGDDAYGHAGFGYVVSHNTQTGNSPLGKANAPTKVETIVFAGGHHALHRVELVYDRDKEGGGQGIQIPVVIEWLVATGRDHPLWSVTWKLGEAKNPQGVSFDTYRMDTRGPYGSLNFDGATSKGAGDVVGGVAWGDFGLAFETTNSPLSLAASWTYDTPNTVSYVHAWTANVNAEMGIVRTLASDKTMGYGDRVFGRERGSTSAGVFAAKGDCNGFGDARVYAMPCVNGWPYQMMQYDWDAGGDKPVAEATGTKLLAWGTPYGFLGAKTFDNLDYSAKVDGTGDRSYATYVVLGPKCRYEGAVCKGLGDVSVVKREVEALAAATVGSVVKGKLAASAPRGPGAQQTKALVQGYDDTYAATVLEADAGTGSVAFTITPAAGKPLKKPLLIVRGAKAGKPTITVGGAVRTVNTGADDAGAFVSYRTDAGELWLTLNQNIDGPTAITIDP